ncbi:MAG TPA: alpha/beta hydrolase-fold protein [Chitinophagaceae bacterium]|nr:alpha/beta hydrolase-fold protein [Chitinophagaceae bacterium]
MKQFLLLLVAAYFISACNRPAGNNTDNKIVIGTIDSLYSGLLHEERQVWVYVPESYKRADKNNKPKYPVLYLLDGDAHFYSVVGMIHQLSVVNGNTICPEMIVVGIPNTDRTRDLTPTHVVVDPPYMDSASAKTSGGGEQFAAFIEKELIPHIDSLYPVAPYKMLVGHSFGGLTVMNILMHHTSLFNAYIAIDPSMWWDNQKLLKELQAGLPNKDFSHTSLFLGIANTMEAGMDTMKIQSDTSPVNKHIRSILALSHSLAANAGKNGMRFSYKYYNSDNHGSVPLITEYDGLHFLFDYYKLNLTNNDFLNIDHSVLAKITGHYDTVSSRLGYKILPPLDLVNALAYQAMSTKHNAAAEEAALLNVTNYPANANAFDTLGDVYNAEGNKEKAIENYKKALSIDAGLAETKMKLDKLESK